MQEQKLNIIIQYRPENATFSLFDCNSQHYTTYYNGEYYLTMEASLATRYTSHETALAMQAELMRLENIYSLSGTMKNQLNIFQMTRQHLAPDYFIMDVITNRFVHHDSIRDEYTLTTVFTHATGFETYLRAKKAQIHYTQILLSHPLAEKTYAPPPKPSAPEA